MKRHCNEQSCWEVFSFAVDNVLIIIDIIVLRILRSLIIVGV